MQCISLIYITFLLSLPGYELSSDEEELPLQPDDPADGGSALDDLQPHNGPPILQQPPALPPFDFLAILRRSGGNTSELLASLREADTYLPPGPIHVYSERAGGAVRLYIVHIVHISLCRSCHVKRRFFRHSNQHMEPRQGSTLHYTLPGWRWHSQQGLPCFEMGNDSAWQCWRDGQVCSAFCASG